MLGRLLRLWLCRRGIAATEFALVLPLMVLVLAGTAELGNALLLDRKVTRAAHIASDLVAQEETVDTAVLNDFLDAVERVLVPYPTNAIRISLTSVWRDPDTDSLQVDWSIARNTSALSTGSAYVLPTDMVPVIGESVIVAEIEYAYSPLYADLITGGLILSDRAYLRPRRTTRVTRL
ncbi:MAG: hypothetical protein FJX68_11355 [Alphaproteobacteria bacterium]|nr:hypothetical protein [Alphaproteobacteria bacterium]